MGQPDEKVAILAPHFRLSPTVGVIRKSSCAVSRAERQFGALIALQTATTPTYMLCTCNLVPGGILAVSFW